MSNKHMLDTSRESYLASVCERDIHELAEKTNKWWYATGGERPDLLHYREIADWVYRWALETGRPVRINHDHPSVIFQELAACWNEERDTCKAEARRYVMDQAAWRRVIQEDPLPLRPAPKTAVTVGPTRPAAAKKTPSPTLEMEGSSSR